ncbi:MAG TPA: hypothetical protein VG939_00115 [Caulobacteraceae bacterium]|nr:hypothetical protein [Caulobacteraceae bacterium]
MASLRIRFAALALALAAAAGARAEPLHGRVELTGRGEFARSDSVDAALGEKDRAAVVGDLRLVWQPHAAGLDFDLQYELTAEAGGTVALARDTSALGAPAPPATLFDLTSTLADDRRLIATGHIDRLSVAWSSPDLVLKLGRQAITWGAGQVFHPMDLVDPFAPAQPDTEYKPGVDMAYAQVLFADGSDLQLIAVPRRPAAGRPVTADASTFAAHYHRTAGALSLTGLAARDHGDWTLGVGVGGPLAGAAWNVEIVPTIEPGGAVRTSALANISRGVTLFGRNATVLAEYYRNGFGVSGDRAIAALPADLAGRLARGQLFVTGRDALAGAVSLEVTPLVTLSPTIIADLDGPSLCVALQAQVSLSNEADLIAGVQAPVGARGTAYGGRPLTGSGGPFVAAPTTVYILVRRHF